MVLYFGYYSIICIGYSIFVLNIVYLYKISDTMKTPQYFDRILNWKKGTAKDIENSIIAANITTITNNYTIDKTDHGKILEVNGLITITLPNDLPDGFNCSIVNIGASVVTLSASTLRATATTITTQYNAATVYCKRNIWTAIGGLG